MSLGLRNDPQAVLLPMGETLAFPWVSSLLCGGEKANSNQHPHRGTDSLAVFIMEVFRPKSNKPNISSMKANLFTKQTRAAATALALFTAGFGSVAYGDQTFDTPIAMPMTVKATVNSVDCNNRGGP